MAELWTPMAVLTKMVKRQLVDPTEFHICQRCQADVEVTDLSAMGFPGAVVAPKLCGPCADKAEAEELGRKLFAQFTDKLHALPVPIDTMSVKLGDLKPTVDLECHRETVRDYLREWTTNRERGIGLTLQSEITGNGKSTLARAIATFLRGRQVKVCMMRAERFRQVMSDKATRPAAESVLNNCDLFILDDLGTEKATADALIAISELIEDFNQAKRPLIITKNESLETMAKAYAKVDSRSELRWVRIGDRIRERNISLTFVGSSLRKNLGGNA